MKKKREIQVHARVLGLWRVSRASDRRSSGTRAFLTYVRLGEIKLRAQIGQCTGGMVVERDGLDAAEDDVLGDLDAETAEAGDEHVGGRHAAHGVVSEDVELPRVQTLVDLGGRPASGAAAGARGAVLRHVYVHLRHVRRRQLVVGSSRRAGSTNASLLGWGINGALHHLSTRHRRT